MIFTRRHEQELAEIKALTEELDQRVQEGLEQLARIREGQDRLAGRSSIPATQSSQTPPPRPENRSVEPIGQRPQRRGGIAGTLRQMVYGPEIELAGGETEAGTSSGGAPADQPQATPAVGDNGAGPLLAFVHIPKTAGGTVISMFAAAYSKAGVRDAGNYLRNPEDAARAAANPKKREGRVLAGHVPYGLLHEHLPPDTRYMTFLREPADRVLSHYYRHVLSKDPRVEKAVRRPGRAGNRVASEEEEAQKLDLLEEALVESSLPHLTNLCTRFLCGHDDPLGELPASAVDDAKENLRQFAFVGIQERFEESLVLLQRMLGLESIPYQDRHVSLGGSRPAADELPDERRALIVEYNRLDVELYRFGLGLFEEAVAAADQGFAEDVEALLARSASSREEEWHEAAQVPS